MKKRKKNKHMDIMSSIVNILDSGANSWHLAVGLLCRFLFFFAGSHPTTLSGTALCWGCLVPGEASGWISPAYPMSSLLCYFQKDALASNAVFLTWKAFSLIWFYGTSHDCSLCYTSAAHANQKHLMKSVPHDHSCLKAKQNREVKKWQREKNEAKCRGLLQSNGIYPLIYGMQSQSQ